LGLRSWPLCRLWPGLRCWGGPVLGLRLAVLRLLRAELRLLRSGLRLDWTRLLRLDGSRLRLLRLNGANLLRWGRPIVGLYGSDLWLAGALWLAWAGPVVRLNGPDLRLAGSDLGLAGTDFGLTRSYLGLARAGGLYLRPVVWFTRTESRLGWAGFGLSRTNFGLSRAVSRSGAGESRLRGDRPGGCDDGWAASVDVVELLAVLCCFALVLDLSGHGRDSGTAHGFDFGWPRSVSDAASASVVGDAGVVVDDDRTVVDVGDTRVDAVNGAIVVEVIAVPVAAVIADAGVSEAVVDAAVEADVRAPEATVKAPAVAIPAPVAGGPEGAIVGWSAPGAGDPVVAGGSPVPVAGGPDVVGRGGFRLLVDGQGRRGLVGVFDGGSFPFCVELLGGLRVLIGLVLIGRGRGGLLGRILLGRILLGTLLRLGLGANSEDCTPGCRCRNRQRLIVRDWRHVGVCRVWA
jgi:hypothetical protein